MKLFEDTFHLTRDTRVLDVGGSMAIWQHAALMPRLTLANLPNALRPHGGGERPSQCRQAKKKRQTPFQEFAAVTTLKID
jgi:hypothetical protein